MRLYHLTLSENLDSIRWNGLNPGISKRPIYLAENPGHAGAYEAQFAGREVVLLEVNMDVLDPDRLGPDDDDMLDLMEQAGDERSLSEITWQESLERSGQVTYSGRIPYSAIRVVKRWKAV
jgi:hypothetical protein